MYPAAATCRKETEEMVFPAIQDKPNCQPGLRKECQKTLPLELAIFRFALVCSL
jgi:hypothetical protein